MHMVKTNLELTGTTSSESGRIRTKQTRNKKSFYQIFLAEKLVTIITNKTPAKTKYANYGPLDLAPPLPYVH